MAYTSGVFRIDYVNGSDSARTALTSVSFAWNAGTSKMRATKTAHGLVTGAVVDVTGSTGLNDAWKITKIDNNTFDLDSSTNVANTSGTVTPRGGSSWSDAWKTFSSGATAARIQPGDEMRVAKTADPVSTGINTTWTNGSASVTLASPITKTVEDCTATTGWVASANITLGTDSSRKIGSNALTITPAAGFTTGKVCYKDLGSNIDFSGFTKISFFFRTTTNTISAANTYRLALCSDTTGDTVVEQYSLPATFANSSWNIFVYDKGSALSSSIRSVAIYADIDPGITVVSINNIVACNSITHATLVGPATNDCVYNIQSFTDSAIVIDSANNTVSSRGWYGSTTTTALLYRTGLEYYTDSSIINYVEAGTPSLFSKLIGGWNTTNDTKDGITCFANNCINTGAFVNSNGNWAYFIFENFISARFNTHFQTGKWLIYNDIVACGGNSPFVSNVSHSRVMFNNIRYINNSNGFVFQNAGMFIMNNSTIASNTLSSLTFNGVCFLNNCVSANHANGFSGVNTSAYMRNCLILDVAESNVSTNSDYWIWSFNHDQTADNHYGWTGGAICNWQTTTKQGSDPGAWDLFINQTARSINTPARITAAEIAVTANNLVTVKAWVKKSHATNIGCRIIVLDALYSLPGITETSATAADNTNWQELTITFTPTVSGVVPVYFDGFYINATANVYLGSVTITQA